LSVVVGFPAAEQLVDTDFESAAESVAVEAVEVAAAADVVTELAVGETAAAGIVAVVAAAVATESVAAAVSFVVGVYLEAVVE
jgi:hypothetical protein